MRPELNLDENGSDRATLDAQYAEPSNVEKRAAIYDYCEFQTPVSEDWTFADWVLSALPWEPTESVLDLGAGTGHLLRRLSDCFRFSIGIDLSPAMASRAQMASPLSSVVVGDAAALPIATGSLDGVLAAYVLFHVQDVRSALEEIHRALRPDGSLVMVLNGRDDKAELLSVIRQAGQAVLGGEFEPPAWSMHCDLDSIQEPLVGLFEVEASESVVGSFVFDTADPACDWFASLRSGSEGAISDEVWDRILVNARGAVEDRIEREGRFESHRETGVLVVRPV